MESLLHFQQQLEQCVGRPLHLRINDNRSTMMSVRWDSDRTRVSLHRMFLEAPPEIVDALGRYLRRGDKRLGRKVRQFIDQYSKRYEYTDRLNVENLETKGKVYDLEEIYDQVNQEYFDRELDLSITWFGRCGFRRKRHTTFGLYQGSMKLVKVHRMLDEPFVPEYFVRYIVYHEMCHHVCPSYHDENGRHRIHSPEFKQKEMLFREFAAAKEWIKNYQGGKNYGRS